MTFFFFYKVREQEDRQFLPGEVAGINGSRLEMGKGCERANIVQILCTHIIIVLCTIIAVETIPGMEVVR
jgi:hypothetical protein